MSILQELIEPLHLSEFYRDYLFKAPFAAPFKATRVRDLVSWTLLGEIFESGHGDCWLPKEGRLPEDKSLSTGKLTLEQARKGFNQGRTVLVRHAENAHPKLKEIAQDFHSLFSAPIDIQLYCTPAGEEGFDWHYDLEEVFVLQSAGEKEFRLRRNRQSSLPDQVVLPERLNLDEVSIGPEIRCLLHAGDWLYIPAGYWHKARALTDSFHLSVGVTAINEHRMVESLRL